MPNYVGQHLATCEPTRPQAGRSWCIPNCAWCQGTTMGTPNVACVLCSYTTTLQVGDNELSNLSPWMRPSVLVGDDDPFHF